MVASDSSGQSAAKGALRRQFLRQRQSLTVETWQTQSLALCAQLRQSDWFQRSHTILAYFSSRQEPDLSTLFPLPKIWGFPRCVGQNLVWHHWTPTSDLPLQTGAFDILEPAPVAPLLEVDQVDLILVPAVACDRQGYRLGYGGGFYDRLLSDLNWQRKPTIGIVFEFAHVPQLPHDSWDCPLQAICTETGLFTVP